MDSGKLRAVWAAHRRCGKDKTLLNHTVKSMVQRVGVYYYIFPTFAQARRVIWDGIDKDGKRFMDHFPKELIDGKPNETEMKLRFTNGSMFQLVGSDKVDSIVGTNPVGVVFSEYALQDPVAWGFIRPILAENGGWAIFASTVRGENHFYHIYELAKSDPANWHCQMDKASETKAIPQDVLDNERTEIIRLYGSDALYEQEYECNFSVPIAGAYYAENIARAYRDGRVGHVPHEPRIAVDTWWDLGINDRMSIWFTQSVGQELRVIDFYESSGQGLPHYIGKMKEKGYVYGKHTAPHDIEVRELTSGKSRRETAAALGINFDVAPRLPIVDGIDAVRGVFPKTWFDAERCRDGLNALKNYRKQYDEKRKTYLNNPYHDWSSNACFVGGTEVLTRYGTCQIMDLPEKGEVLTPCGWKAFQNPRVTRKNVRLVEVVFSDGYTVKCTPDHLFLTESGWKSAESLGKGSSVLSSLTLSRSISMAAYTVLGLVKDILRVAGSYFTEMFGYLLSVLFQKEPIYTIKTGNISIISCQILNANQSVSIYPTQCENDTLTDQSSFIGMQMGQSAHLVLKPEPPLLNGTDQKQEGCGIAGMQSDRKHGQNGRESKSLVSSAGNSFWRWFVREKSTKNTVPSYAKPRIIESVENLSETSDVWCITVPDGASFSLANGAVVHNCDAFRTLATALDFTHRGIPANQPDKYARHYVRQIQGRSSPMGVLG
jgi:hypothetical protein